MYYSSCESDSRNKGGASRVITFMKYMYMRKLKISFVFLLCNPVIGCKDIRKTLLKQEDLGETIKYNPKLYVICTTSLK